MTKRDLILYREDDEIVMPYIWKICGHCNGDGTSSAYLGVFTREGMDQMDEEWKDDYFAGRFDRACECCGGSGKVKSVDRNRASPQDLKDWDAQQAEEAAYRQTERMERLMEGGWREEGWFDHE